MGVLVDPHSGLLCGAFLAFVLLGHFLEKTFNDLSMIFHQNETNLVSTRGIVNKNNPGPYTILVGALDA